MLRTTGVGQKIVELLKRRTVNCRTTGIAPIHIPCHLIPIQPRMILGFTVLVEFPSVAEAKLCFDDAFAAVKNEFGDARLKEKSHTETTYTLLV